MRPVHGSYECDCQASDPDLETHLYYLDLHRGSQFHLIAMKGVYSAHAFSTEYLPNRKKYGFLNHSWGEGKTTASLLADR